MYQEADASLTPEMEQTIARAVLTTINNLRSESVPPVIDLVIEERRDDVVERQEVLESERISRRQKNASQSSR